MGIREWCSRLWHRIRGEKKVEEAKESAAEVVGLTAEPAPEPVPDRKTSDEIIQEMADSHLPAGDRMQEESPEEVQESCIREESPEEDPQESCIREEIPEEDPQESSLQGVWPEEYPEEDPQDNECGDAGSVCTERIFGENTDEEEQ